MCAAGPINQRLVFSVANQAIVYDCVRGRPDASPAAVCTIYDPRYDRDNDTANAVIVAEHEVTRSAVDMRLSGAAGPDESNPRLVPITAGYLSGLSDSDLEPGDFVWLENASEQRERVQVAKVGTSSIEVVDELKYAYAANDLCVGAKLTTAVIPTAFIEDDDNIGRGYYAEFTYYKDGQRYVDRARFDIVRETPVNLVTSARLYERHPWLARILPRERPNLDGYIAAAARDVEAHMLPIADPALVRSCEQWALLVELRAVQLVAIDQVAHGNVNAQYWAEHAKGEYEGLRDSYLNGRIKFPYDTNEDDVDNDAPPQTNTYYL